MSMFAVAEDDFPVVDFKGWKLGFLICYDVEFPENTRKLALAGADLILVPTANMEPYDFVAEVTVRARAFENQCYLIYANYCGSEGDIHYCGLSSICAPDGKQIGLAGHDEVLVTATLDRQVMNDSRAINTYFNDRRPGFYSGLSKI
jgi:predicted amidohydrolase